MSREGWERWVGKAGWDEKIHSEIGKSDLYENYCSGTKKGEGCG